MNESQSSADRFPFLRRNGNSSQMNQDTAQGYSDYANQQYGDQQSYANGVSQNYGNGYDAQGQGYGNQGYGDGYGDAAQSRPRHAQQMSPQPHLDAAARAASAVANARRGGGTQTLQPPRPQQSRPSAATGSSAQGGGESGPSNNSKEPQQPKVNKAREDAESKEEQEVIKAQELARSMSLPYVDLDEYPIDKTVVNIVSGDMLRKNQMLPIDIIKGQLAVAVADPTNFAALDDISAATGMTVLTLVATPTKVQQSINRYIRANDELTEISEEIVANSRKEVSVDETEQDTEADSPVARFVSLIISQAIDDHCSDIHIEPQEKGLQVRFRIDGVLHVFQQAPKEMTQGVISRIKVLSDMDIGEHRKPQDGRITVRHNGKNVDLRVAALPTVWGEKIVMRILSTPAGNLKVEDLNFSERNYEVFKNAYSRPYGMVLVTGPTGSGKSTTLYATLGNVARPEINVITVEDPVEFRMAGINQVQVNNKAGMTFAAALRSILRADPDVVLIGEIRDAETAKIATEAALTGHLVLSTLHTNDAPSAVSRLIEMGVEPFLISASLCAVMAQRLARRLCPYCKREDKATPAELKIMGVDYHDGDELPTVYRPGGCKECSNTGYHGRVAVQQVMGVGPDLESMIARGATAMEIQEQAEKDGMTSLRDDGWEKVLQGITSVDEIIRVTV